MHHNILEPTEKSDLVKKSSISQHKNKLSVIKGAEYVPIAFDTLDYIDCDRAVSHPTILAIDDDLGYFYPVSECKFYTDNYVYHDGDRVELKTLPHWFGEGLYQESVKKYSFTNADNGALGTHNEQTLRIGEDYVTTKETLRPIA